MMLYKSTMIHRQQPAHEEPYDNGTGKWTPQSTCNFHLNATLFTMHLLSDDGVRETMMQFEARSKAPMKWIWECLPTARNNLELSKISFLYKTHWYVFLSQNKFTMQFSPKPNAVIK